MKNRVGVGAIKKKKEESSKFAAVGRNLEITKATAIREMLDNFKTTLGEFAEKHRDKINADPEFRHQFHVMCREVGVDPLASSKGFWSDILGLGDYYFELGVKVVQICIQTRQSNGGVISLNQVLHLIKLSPSSARQQDTSIDDIRHAVIKLQTLQSGFRLVEIKGNFMLFSVPLEMNQDQEDLMSASQSQCGCITEETMTSEFGWSGERFAMIIHPLLREGIIWEDFHEGVTRYYFPSVWQSCAMQVMNVPEPEPEQRDEGLS